MDIKQIWELQAMIREAEFLTPATKEVFLKKLPYLPDNKFHDLYDIFAKDAWKRKAIKQKRLVVFEQYKTTVVGIYHKAKQVVIAFKEKAVASIDKRELEHLDEELEHA